MTGNQIAYARYREDQRHNLVSESLSARSIGETERHNRETERYSWSSLLESTRHNQQTEQLGWASLAETTRHNKAGEAYNLSYLSELTRHNKAGEAISWYNANTQYQDMLERARHNQAVEAETYRSNVANERFNYYKNPYSIFFNPDVASSTSDQYLSSLYEWGSTAASNTSNFWNNVWNDVSSVAGKIGSVVFSPFTYAWNAITGQSSETVHHGTGVGRSGR